MQRYDYIVIGAGSSGCVLAARLSERPDVQVLLLEAGPPDRNPWIHVPGGIFKLIHNRAIDWCHETEPEPGLDGRRIALPAGRVLGGSSSINGMVYVRGQREDYDGWREAGNPGWGYDDVLPLFKASERQARGADAFHGADGPLAVSDPRFELPLVQAFIDAAAEAGIPRNADFNGATQEGAGPYQLTVDRGRRCSAARAFLAPARARPNLHVMTGVVVHRLVVEGTRVRGVTFRRGGLEERVDADAEVLLCAGAIGSPQVLLQSGIGEPMRLMQHGVPVVHPLRAVGRHFQDHYQARLVFRTREPITLNDRARHAWQRGLIGADYLLRRRGALTFGASLAGAFASTSGSPGRPDVQFHFQPLSVDSYDTGLHRFSAFTLSVCQLRPESRGDVGLRAADGSLPPRVRGNYLNAGADVDALLRGFRLAQDIVRQPALARLVQAPFRPADDLANDADAIAFCRHHGTTIFHPSGTCRMGPTPADAVVDASLRVHGLDGLRVADASIMPTLVSGNTNAACIMIGEKAARLVLAARDGKPSVHTSAKASRQAEPA